MSDRPRVLVTNDDGIESAGVIALAKALAKDYEVLLVTPDDDMSGTGTGIGRFDATVGVDLRPVEVDGLEAEAYTISGPPGLAVMSACLGAFGPVPDLVASGINAGINTGHSVIHSGTVGAALTARTFGSRGLAVSVAQSDPWQWETAATIARAAAQWMCTDPKRPKVLNINVPGVPIDQIEGIHWADLDEFGYFRVATAEHAEEKLQFVVGPDSSRSDSSTDTYLLGNHLVTVTPLSAIEPAPFPNVLATDIWSPEN